MHQGESKAKVKAARDSNGIVGQEHSATLAGGGKEQSSASSRCGNATVTSACSVNIPLGSGKEHA